MKRILTFVFTVILLASCYDDTYLREKVEQLDQNVTNLDSLVSQMNAVIPQIKVENDSILVSYDKGSTWESLGCVASGTADTMIETVLKVEEGHLYVSYDGGNKWDDLGDIGSQANECVIESVVGQDGCLVLTLTSGTTFMIPLESAGIRSYYADEVEATKAAVYALTNEPCLVFPMITDIHYLAVTSDVPELIDYTVENMLALQEDINFDFLVCLGDLCRGDETKEKTEAAISHVYDQFRRMELPIYACVGNHDDNRYYKGDKTSRFDNSLLYNLMIRDTGEVMFDMSSMNGTNFYRDFPGLGIRLIFLNSNEENAGDDVSFSAETLAWFDAAMDTDKDVYVFSHGSPVKFSRSEDAEYPKNGEAMVEVMKNSDNFKMFFHGHNHFDCEFTAPFNDTDNPILAFSQTCHKCYTKTIAETAPLKATYPERTPGTVTEDCFDIVVIRPRSGKVNLVRFGAGVDREFSVGTGSSVGESAQLMLPETIDITVDFMNGTPFNQSVTAAADQVPDGETYTLSYPYEVGGVMHSADFEFKVRGGCDTAAKDYYELNENGLYFKNVAGTQKSDDYGAIALPAIRGRYLNKVEIYCTSLVETAKKRMYMTTIYEPGKAVHTGVADCAVSPYDAKAYQFVYELPASSSHKPYAYSKADADTRIEPGDNCGSIAAYKNKSYTIRMREGDLRIEKLVLKYTKTEPVHSAN